MKPELRNLIFDTSRPITWGKDGALNEHILGKLQEIDTRLSHNGYQVLMGSEQEFTLHENNHEWYNEGGLLLPERARFLEERRENALQLLYFDTPAAERDKPAYKEREAAIRQFSPQELLMYELHEEYKDLLEYKFGTSRAGDGYYDVHNVLEVDVKPCHAVDAVNKYRTFLLALNAKASEYGFFVSYHPRHISLSVSSKQDGQLLDAGREDTQKRSLQLASGVVKCAYDALPCLSRRYARKNRLPGSEFIAGPERIHPIRIREMPGGGIIELRVNDNPLSGGHFAMAALTLLSGVDYGLNYHYEHHRHGVKPLAVVPRKLAFTPQKEMFFTAEILSAADMDDEGNIKLNERNYKQIAEYLPYLAKEIEYQTDGKPTMGDVPKLAKIIEELRIDNSGLTFPENGYFRNCTSNLQERIGRIEITESPTISSQNGYVILEPEEQISHMHQSAALRKLWGDKLLDEICTEHALDLNMDWPKAGARQR